MYTPPIVPASVLQQYITWLSVYCHYGKQLATVNQHILVAIKFGISQTKNDLAAIKFGMSRVVAIYSFLSILTFPHRLGQVYLWQIRLCSLQVDPISLEHQCIGLYLLLCIYHKIMFTPIHSSVVDKVSRAYVNPYIPTHKPMRRIKVYAITRLILNLLFGVALMSDLAICKFRKSMVIQDTECPY